MLTPYYSDPSRSFTLYKGDTMQLLAEMTDKFDMVFADPPYFLSKGFSIKTKSGYVRTFDKGDWDKQISPDRIEDFNRKWLTLCRERLYDHGTIWVSGTYHNIFQVANCLIELGFKILNIVVWQKSDPPTTFTKQRFNFSAEYLIWARKEEKVAHYFNYDLTKVLNGGVHMPDVWKIPSVANWEKKCGKHPTQKPLHLLYRIILANTRPEDRILDPFAGSCTTGIAARLLGRQFVGFDLDEKYLDLGRRRYEQLNDEAIEEKMLKKISENPEEVMVIVNHARRELREKMIETGICYLRAGDSQGSLLVTSGFERLQYLLLHTNGENVEMFRLKTKGRFQIWTKETLEEYGFTPEHAPYYIVLKFYSGKKVEFKRHPRLKEGLNTYRAKIRPLSDFVGIR